MKEKVKSLDLLSKSANVVVRYQQGTQLHQEQTFAALIPSGILYPDTECLIGWTVIDPGF